MTTADDAPDSPLPRPGSGRHDLAMLVVELGEHVHEMEKLLVRHGVESDGRWVELRAAIASQQGAVRRLGDQAILTNAEIATLKRDVAALLEMMGAIAKELSVRATQDSVHDLAIAENKAERSALTKRVAQLADQVTLRRTAIVGALTVGAAIGRVLLDWLGRHGF